MVENSNQKLYQFGSSTYEVLEQLGKGTYGSVVRAINTKTKEDVAIKKIKLDVETEGIPATALREIAILKHFQHQNIVKLQHLSLCDKKILLCLEYLEYDLKKFWDMNFKGEEKVKIELVKSILYQIIRGTDFLHSKKILHRDLKPQNILVDKNIKIKLADFGLSRTYSIPIRPYTKEVLTLWYRAPELILGAEYYSTGIDVWSIGCIFAELLLKKPLFVGDSEISQLFKIFEVFGNPTEDSLPGYKTFPYFKSEFPFYDRGTGLEERLKNTVINKEGIDLISKMLVYNPSKRISCREALKHSFFNGVYDPFLKNTNNNNNS